jgi:hypothetical protein
MLSLSLVESLSILGGAIVAGGLLYLILRPLRIDMTIRHEPPSDTDSTISGEKED